MIPTIPPPAGYWDPPDDELPEPDPSWLADTVAQLRADGYGEDEIEGEVARLWERVWSRYQYEEEGE